MGGQTTRYLGPLDGNYGENVDQIPRTMCLDILEYDIGVILLSMIMCLSVLSKF